MTESMNSAGRDIIMDAMEALLEELHGTARLQVHLARMDGHRIDKHTMRFNDIVNAAVQYGRMSSCFRENTARAAIYETAEYCVIGSPMHTGQPFDCMAYKWMEAAQ